MGSRVHGIYKSGGYVYVGPFSNEMRHGFGEMTYPSGDVYSGYWRDGKRHGVGAYRWSNGEQFYVGDWVQNDRSGMGSLTFAKTGAASLGKIFLID